MASTLIGRIARRAKQIRKAKPNIDWQTAIKKASLELKGTVRPATKPVTKRRKKVSVKSLTPKKRMSGMPIVGRVRRVSAPRKKTTVASTLKRAKKMLLEEIGEMESRKFAARLKRDKKKIAKKIAVKKSQFRKL